MNTTTTPAPITIPAEIDETMPWRKGAYRSNAILLIEGSSRAGGPGGWGIGGWTKDGKGRIVHGGDEVPGPHAYAFGRAGVIDNRGGTGRINADAEKAGLLFRVKAGDVLDIMGELYELRLRGGYPELVRRVVS